MRLPAGWLENAFLCVRDPAGGIGSPIAIGIIDGDEPMAVRLAAQHIGEPRRSAGFRAEGVTAKSITAPFASSAEAQRWSKYR
jgi:hypothetical protein